MKRGTETRSCNLWRDNKYYTFRECLFAASLNKDTTRVRLIVICGLTGFTLFSPHYLTNCTTFEKKLRNTKCVCFDFLYNFRLKHLSFQEEVSEM